LKVCPRCLRRFADSDGFCPHDGERLRGAADIPTMAPLVPLPGQTPPPVMPIAKETTPPLGNPMAGFGGGPEDFSRLIGTVIDGRYKIESLLGEGGMGVVYKAQHTLIEKQVAVKVLKAEVAREESVVQRFLQEAKAASRIGHPNIVDVTDFGTLTDGSAYFVMEYIDGDTLARVIHDDAPMPLARALPIVAQLARALDAAHKKGVVHRDLKPDNIFVVERDGRKDVVKIVDFGIAKVGPAEGNLGGPRLTQAGSVFGTPEYMAPEQAAGRGDVDHRADVYALGTIFYEMVVGQVPHRGETLVATLAMQMLDPVPPPSEKNPGLRLDAQIEAVMMTALAKERELRFQNMAELLRALEAVAGNLLSDPMNSTGSVRALPGGPPPAAARPTPPPDATTLRERSAPAALPTRPDAPPAMPGPDTLRVATPDAPTFAPDPAARSPFHDAGGPSGPSRGAPRLTPAEQTTLKPLPSADSSSNALPGLGPPAPRPLPAPPVPRLQAEPLPPDYRRDKLGLSATAKGALLVLLLVGSATLAYALLSKGGGSHEQVAAVTLDAGAGPNLVAAGGPPDAAPAVVPPPPPARADAAPATPDAGATVIAHPPPPPSSVTITVHTSPPGGTFTIDRRAVAIEGSKLTRPRGSKLTLTCEAPYHKDATLTLVFDGKTSSATCKLVRRDACLKELKNPFDPCPP
jgi:serine/threonine-protein kinase